VAIATITRLLVYATTCVALPVLRGRKDMAEAKFRVPFGVAAAVLSLLLITWLLTSIDFAKEGLSLAVWLSIGFVIFGVMRVMKGRRANDNLGEDSSA